MKKGDVDNGTFVWLCKRGYEGTDGIFQNTDSAILSSGTAQNTPIRCFENPIRCAHILSFCHFLKKGGDFLKNVDTDLDFIVFGQALSSLQQHVQYIL
jgi:hypothetical protein